MTCKDCIHYKACTPMLEAMGCTVAGAGEDADKHCDEFEQGWVSVKDRLPDMCGLGCLLAGVNRYGQRRVFEGFTGYIERGKLEWHTNLQDIDIARWEITHWMPLPEPPEVEE